MPTSSVPPTRSAPWSTASQSVCVTRATSLLEQESQDVLTSMSVWDNPVELALFVRILLEASAANARPGFQEMPTLPAPGKLTRPSVPPPRSALEESSAPRVSVCVSEVSRGKAGSAGTWTSVH